MTVLHIPQGAPIELVAAKLNELVDAINNGGGGGGYNWSNDTDFSMGANAGGSSPQTNGYNLWLGANAGANATSESNSNVVVGSTAAQNVPVLYFATLIGDAVTRYANSVNASVYIGGDAGAFAEGDLYNQVVIGEYAGASYTGNSSVIIGQNAGVSGEGAGCIILGEAAGIASNINGDVNIFLGTTVLLAAGTVTASNCLVIGYERQLPVDLTTDNQINIMDAITGIAGQYLNFTQTVGFTSDEVSIPIAGRQLVNSSSSGPTELAPMDFTISMITTDGTGSIQTVDLPTAGMTAAQAGLRHVVYINNSSNPSDQVLITVGGNAFIYVFDPSTATLVLLGMNLTLNGTSALAVFEWTLSFGWVGVDYINWNGVNFGEAFWLNSLVPIPSAASAPQAYHAQVYYADGEGPYPTLSDDLGSLNNSENLLLSSGETNMVGNAIHFSNLSTDGTGAANATGIDAPSSYMIGARKLVCFGYQQNLADTVVFSGTNVETSDGGSVSEIVFNTQEQYLLLEAWDTTTWRIVRTNATVS